MSAQGQMTHTFEVYSRDAAGVLSPEGIYAGSLQELTEEGSRRETRGGGNVDEPMVTHIIRLCYAAKGKVGGMRLRDAGTGLEYIAQVETWRESPPPGTLKVRASHVPARIGNA